MVAMKPIAVGHIKAESSSPADVWFWYFRRHHRFQTRWRSGHVRILRRQHRFALPCKLSHELHALPWRLDCRIEASEKSAEFVPSAAAARFAVRIPSWNESRPTTSYQVRDQHKPLTTFCLDRKLLQHITKRNAGRKTLCIVLREPTHKWGAHELRFRDASKVPQPCSA